jgi:glycerol-3-phosphate dehydrogenase
MNREANLERLRAESFDVLVVGGGATGLGCAVDAAARGYRTALIEAADFAKATSSRSTKLVHGGVRYLQQGNLALVREALHERTYLRANAPDLVKELPFLVPAFASWQRLYYRAGLHLYDRLAGDSGFPRSRALAAAGARERIGTLQSAGLRGGVLYWDAQFDDARLAVALARTAADRGAAIANYVRAGAFRYEGGVLCGVDATDAETLETFAIRARAVINATGIFADALRRMDEPTAQPLLTYSRGSHIVVDGAALGNASTALLVPRTGDGRVLFAIPWHGHALVGTTEIPVDSPDIEPQPGGDEISYILSTLNAYLARPVSRSQIRSAFAGLRPLVNRSSARTAKLSREHVVEVARSGLVTIAGGKWTTYRKMAQDAVDAAERQAGFTHVASSTMHLRLNDATAAMTALDENGQIEHSVRYEMARTVEDVLARRTRLLFVDAHAARASAPAVAQALAVLLRRAPEWQAEQTGRFDALAARYIVTS